MTNHATIRPWDHASPPLPRYFLHERTEVLALVPDAAERVLSIGCGAAATEARLVARGSHVVGIEIDPRAAADARRKGVKVIEQDAAAAVAAVGGESFDCVICADILEHLADPVAVLRDAVAALRPGGNVIISVPNFCHWSVLYNLAVRREFPYAAAGIYDRTHLRITTRRGVASWLEQVGLEQQTCEFLMPRRRARWANAATCRLCREYLGRQVLISARKPMVPA